MQKTGCRQGIVDSKDGKTLVMYEEDVTITNVYPEGLVLDCYPSYCLTPSFDPLDQPDSEG